jgi:hypothetical protein
VSLYPGQSAASFSVLVAGNPPLSYRWFTNGTVALSDNANRIGSTSNVLTIPVPTLADNGNYTVIVTNSFGSVTSTVATLTVLTPGPAVNFTLDFGGTPIIQPTGNDWNTTTNWNPDGLPASVSKYANPNSTYEVVLGSRLRTPAGTNNNIFPGNQLTIDGSGVFEDSTLGAVGEFRFKNNSSPATNYFTKLVLNGGQLDCGDNALMVLQGELNVSSASTIYVDVGAGVDRGYQIDAWLTGSGDLFWHEWSGGLGSFDLQITGTSNTFKGQWIVDQGTLLGVGANSLGTNNIMVGMNGLTAALETLYDINNVNGSLTLGASSEVFLHQNDHFASVTVNGVALANGTYSFATLNSTYPANFPATWTLQNGSLINTGSGQIIVGSGPRPSPHITSIGVNGTTLSINATNGASAGSYVLLGTTNLALPLSQWTSILTNNFDGSGNLNLSTNIINPALPLQFYIISQ